MDKIFKEIEKTFSYWWNNVIWEAVSLSTGVSGMKGLTITLFISIGVTVVSILMFFMNIVTKNWVDITIEQVKYNIIFIIVSCVFSLFIFLILLFHIPAKMHEKQGKDIETLKEKYESENPNIRVIEFNAGGNEFKEGSGITIHNDNPNNDIIDIFVVLMRMVEHKTDRDYKEVGQMYYLFDADNCHFEKWANGKNMVVSKDHNVLYIGGNKNDNAHLFVNKGEDLENNSEPFRPNNETKIYFARYDLFFDIVGKIDRSPKKPFNQSFRGEFNFTRKEQFSPDGALLKTESYYKVQNVIQIVGSGKPLGVVLGNH